MELRPSSTASAGQLYRPASVADQLHALQRVAAAAAPFASYLLVFSCTVFGSGFLSLPIFGCLSPFAMLICWRSRPPSFLHALAVFLSLAFGAWAAFANTLRGQGLPVPEVVAVLLPAGVAIIISMLSILPLLADSAACRRLPALQHIAFPIAFTAVWHCFATVSPTGTTGSPAYAIFNAFGILSFPPFAHLVSLGGTPLVIFVLAYAATFACYALDVAPAELPSPAPPTARPAESSAPLSPADAGSMADAASHGRPSIELPSSPLVAGGWAGGRQRSRAPGVVFTVVVLLVLLYGSTRGVARSWPQRAVEGRVPSYTRMACLVGQANGTTSPATWTRLLERSEALLAGDSPADILIWSEEAVDVANVGDEAALLAMASAIALKSARPLGISYLVHEGKERSRNMFVLLGADGREAMRWQKARPVPGVEPNVVAGDGVVRVVDMGGAVGRVAAVICFDADFPAMVREAGRQGADFLLQPSWTWGPIGEYFAADNALRALEFGFTLFRCSSGGVSGAFGPYGEVFGTKTMHASGSMVLDVPRYGRVWTLYCLSGDVFGWLTIGLAALFVLFLAADRLGAARLCPTRWPAVPAAAPPQELPH